jgi:hypothetical protein
MGRRRKRRTPGAGFAIGCSIEPTKTCRVSFRRRSRKGVKTEWHCRWEGASMSMRTAAARLGACGVGLRKTQSRANGKLKFDRPRRTPGVVRRPMAGGHPAGRGVLGCFVAEVRVQLTATAGRDVRPTANGASRGTGTYTGPPAARCPARSTTGLPTDHSGPRRDGAGGILWLGRPAAQPVGAALVARPAGFPLRSRPDFLKLGQSRPQGWD